MARSDLGIRSEYNRYILSKGQEICLNILDERGNRIDPDSLQFRVNDSRIAGHRLEKITAKDVGKTSVVVSDSFGNMIQVPIQVIPAATDYFTKVELPIIMLDEDRSKYFQRGIFTCHALLDSLELNERFDNGAEFTRDRLYAREAALFELPDMDRNFALLAAFAGIRNIYDLSRVNQHKALSVFKIISPMAHTFDNNDQFVYPEEETIIGILKRASNVSDFSSKYATFVYHDPEPTYLLDYGTQKIKSDTDVLSEALQFLDNISISLPLPRTISGKVVMRKNNESVLEAVPQTGYKVTITGIANPASDKAEDDEDIHTFTDHKGEFIIVMPEKYNMKETVKFTVSYDKSKAEVAAMTSEEMLSSLKQTTFVKRASEIMKAMRIEYYTWIPDADADAETDPDLIQDGHWAYNEIPAIELLEKLDRLKAANNRAKELEADIYKRALAEYDREQLEKQIRELKILSATNFREIFDELSYHLYLKEKELEEVKGKRDRLVYRFDKYLKGHLEKIADALEKDQKELKKSMQDAAATVIEELEAQALDIQHQIDVIRTLKVTCKKEDDGLYRYMLDNTYDYNLRDELTGNVTSVKREELVAYLENDTALRPKLQDYLDQLIMFNPQMDRLREEIKLLKSLLEYAENMRCYEYPEALVPDGSDNDSCDPEENASEDGNEATEGNKEDRLKHVDEEHHVGTHVLDEKTWFASVLRNLYTGALEDCSIFRQKYESFRDVEKELSEKQKEYDRLTEVKEETTREDIFRQYCEDHKDDDTVKNYEKYSRRANELYREIQDIDDTIGVKNIDDFAGSERDNEPYNERSDNSSFQATINSILGKSLDARLEPFELLAENFIGVGSKPRALPTVRLMGEGTKEIELPTDTAPSRVFNYSVMQRLVEPVVTKDGTKFTRGMLSEPIDVMAFKEALYNANKNVPLASSLGIGYILNMHQAWIPDGFALGNLLYSMVLAPGEEQRVIVREHTESYDVSDDASALDIIRDEYANNQIDHETAAFEQAVLRASDASSESSYSTQSTSVGASISAGWGPIGGSISASHSRSSGRSSASAAQNDSYDEISTAAQDFQTSIKTQSERLASAKRLSIRTASSSEKEALSSKIVANHNHSHVMTVQYWEVTRRYKLETCIESIDLILFVPLKPVCFLPDPSSKEETEDDDTNYTAFSGPTLATDVFYDFTKTSFEYRYHSFLRYADILERYLPQKYRGGLELIKKFSAYPEWIPQARESESSIIQLKLLGYFLEYDDISATLYFNKSKNTIEGELEVSEYLTVHPSMNTRKDVIFALKKLRTGYCVSKKVDVEIYSFETSLDEYKTTKITEIPMMIFTFYLPPYLSKDDVSHIEIVNHLSEYSFTLSQNPRYLEDYEIEAIENYEDKKWDFAKDDTKSGRDKRRMAHYREALPECYTNQIQSFSRSELISFGGTKISAYLTDGQGFSEAIRAASDSAEDDTEESSSTVSFREASTKVPTSATKLLVNPIRIDASSHVPVLGFDEIMKIEETFRHVTTNTIRYSIAVWRSLSETELTMMLEQYTVDLDYGKISGDLLKENEEVSIPLLNCINVKKPLGVYGNSMMFPFTYPQELAEKLGKTAGDIQDELYRYHTTKFRVPSTSLSVPTNGMIGEAVLGRTNVSEKIDITRFWNWKDSEIDHMEISQNNLNGHSLLDTADTKWVDAPTQGVTATNHVAGSGLLNSLTSRAQPTFADVLANTDMRGVLQNADNNASAGREQVVKTTSDMTKSAITAAADLAKTMAAKANSASNIVGDKENITSALKKMGLSDSVASKLSDKIASGDTNFSDALTSIVDAGGKSPVKTSSSGSEEEPGKPTQNDSPASPENSDNSLGEIIDYTMAGIESGLSPVEIFNKWMKEKKNSDRNYTEEDIRKIAEKHCEDNGTTMDAVILAINELLDQ